MKRIQRAAAYLFFFSFIYAPTILVVYFFVTRSYIPIDTYSEVRFVVLALFIPIVLKYVVHLLVAPWFPFVEYFRSKRRGVSGTPAVSVLIAARNEEVGIIETLQSIISTKYPKLEIVLVNDKSTDLTHEIVRQWLAAYRTRCARRGTRPITLRYRKGKGGGKACALNTALALARGEIVITIDADSVMDRQSIRRMVKHFVDPRVASVAGNVVIGNRTRPLGLIQQLEYLYGFYFKRADSVLNSVYIVGGAAAAYRREVIVRLGGFDENMVTEDIELSTRLQDHGYLIRYAPDAIVYTEGPSDFKGLCRQRFRWKYGRLLTFYKYRHLFFSIRERHNKYLAWVILPIALFAELLLFFEYVLLAIFFIYTYTTNDFGPLVIVISLLAVVIGMQILSDPNMRYHKNLLLFAPGAWIMFYIMDFIEFQALLRSIWCLVNNKKFQWQHWSRVGVFGREQKGYIVDNGK